MVDSSGSVRLAPPPPWFLRAANPAMRQMLASRLGRWLDRLMIIEFTGRRTGHTIRTPVGCHLVQGVPHTTTDRAWRLNFTGGAPVTVTQGGRVRHGTAVLLDLTADQVGAFLRTMLDNGDPPYSMGLRVARGHTPSVAELSRLGQSVIRYDLVD